MKPGLDSIFDGLSQHIPYKPGDIRLLRDKCIIRDLGDAEQIGSIFIPQTVQHAGGVGKQGLLRLGEVMAIGPGDKYHDWGGNEFGVGWNRRLHTKPCPGCEGGTLRLMCEACGGEGRVPVVMEVQCAVGDKVIYERRKEADFYMDGIRYNLVFAEQSVLAVIEELAEMDKIEGYLEVGTNDKGEVVVNHPDLKPDHNGVGHIVFSPDQARNLARLLHAHADEAEGSSITNCICPDKCDCQAPDGPGVRLVSNYCPQHNEKPNVADECQYTGLIHRNGALSA